MTLPGRAVAWPAPSCVLIGTVLGIVTGLIAGVVDAINRGHPGYVLLSLVLYGGLGFAAGLIVGILGTLVFLTPLGRTPTPAKVTLLVFAALLGAVIWEVICIGDAPLNEWLPIAVVTLAGSVVLILVGNATSFLRAKASRA